MSSLSWRQIVLRKQDEREARVVEMEEELGLLSDHPEDEVFLSARPENIVANLKSMEDGWTVERAMIAFIRGACAAHRSTNCLTEVFFKEALDEARLKDKELRSTGRAEGAFWGLPSSFKDSFNILGTDNTVGCTRYCYDPTTKLEDEHGIVKLYRQAGGIPFCKTNIPQTLLAFESKNPLWGASSQPEFPDRTPGGSSGGEAALIKLRGTPLGWGSDIGGSLRIPAHYCGIYALKPVKGRWPSLGSRENKKGFETIKVSCGPMARSVDDLIFASKTITELAHARDRGIDGETLLPIPWREIKLPSRLRVGYFIETGGVKTSPACSRAVQETVDKLRQAGHEVVPFKMPDPIQALKIFVASISADGHVTMKHSVGKDPWEPALQLVTIGSSLPRFLHALLVWVLVHLLKDTIFAAVFSVTNARPVREYCEWAYRRNTYAQKFNKAAWEEEKLDMVICPVQSVPSLQHGRTKFLSPLAIATMLFNVADSTVGVVPVTKVDREKDALPIDFLKESEGSWILEKRVYKGSDPAYNAEKMDGLPVGVQLVGRPWEEEKVLAMMKVVDDVVNLGSSP